MISNIYYLQFNDSDDDIDFILKRMQYLSNEGCYDHVNYYQYNKAQFILSQIGIKKYYG
jgi:hypothetical protein